MISTQCDGSDGKESACKVGDLGLIPGSGRSPGKGNSYPPQYSCLENFMDRGAWWAIAHGVTKSQTWLNDCTELNWTCGSDGRESLCNAGDLGLIPGSGRSPGWGHGNPLQYSCLENFMDRGAWQATAHGVTKSQMQLSTNMLINFCLFFFFFL